MIPRHLQITFALLVIGVFAMSVYVLELKERAEASVARAEDHALAPPAASTAEPVKLFVAYDDEGVLLQRSAVAALPLEPTARAKEVLRTLMAGYMDHPSPHPIAPGSDVNEVFIVNKTLAVVDLNSAFADGHRSGVWEEALSVDSMVATLAANVPGITQVKFLVDGQERETLAGHADLMSVYQVADVQQLVQDLQ
jgi:sporulation and spore germination protein